jgi:dihydrofolate reductase
MVSICAVSKNFIIGDSQTNSMPWTKNRGDLDWFKNKTLGKSILVGYNTFISLPKLKDRHVYFLTRDKSKRKYINLNQFGLEARPVDYFEGVFYDELNCKEIKIDFLCGGRQIYKSFVAKCSELFLTEFDFEVSENEFSVKFPFTKLEIQNMFKKVEKVKDLENGVINRYFESKENS